MNALIKKYKEKNMILYGDKIFSYFLLYIIGKINLCKDCVIFHNHINCQSFFEEKNRGIEIDYKDAQNDITILKKLKIIQLSVNISVILMNQNF